MKRLAFALLLFAMPAAAQDGDLSIDAHRLGVMVDESDAALHVISPKWQTTPSASDEDGDGYAALVSTMRRFLQIEMRACRDQVLGFQICQTPPSAPRWMSERPADLRPAVDEASDRIAAFWSDVCARAKAASPNICVME